MHNIIVVRACMHGQSNLPKIIKQSSSIRHLNELRITIRKFEMIRTAASKQACNYLRLLELYRRNTHPPITRSLATLLLAEQQNEPSGRCDGRRGPDADSDRPRRRDDARNLPREHHAE